MGTIFTLTCPLCPEEFKAYKISDVMAALRFHKELRHIEAKIETDT